MDNVPDTSSFGDSFTDLPVDDLLSSSDGGLTSGITGGISSGAGTAGGIDPSGILNAAQSIIDPANIISALPGGSAIKTLLGLIGNLVPILEKDLTRVESVDIMAFVSRLLGYSAKGLRILEFGVDDAWKIISDISIGPIFAAMLEGGLDVHLSEFDDKELVAVQTVNTMLGFATAMPLICSGIDAAGKFLTANRWPESVHDALAKLPEEMGLSWALGTVIDEAFTVAQGEVLAEAIRKQKRPSRIAWQQLRALFKQHILSHEDAKTLLEAQGFPDEQIDLLLQLSDVQIPIGDIQQMYFRGDMSENEARRAIAALGFNSADTQRLFTLYIEKADTQASTALRNISRQMFTDHLLDEAQYRGILLESNFPSKLVEQDITAVKLEQSVGKLLHTVAVIKSRYQHHEIDPPTATQQLAELNYSASYIAELLQSWDNIPLRAKHGLSQAKVLSYLNAGILQPDSAKSQLQADGLTAEAAQFLIDHPTASAGVKLHARTPGLVLAAYVDGAISPSELDTSLTSAGVRETDIPYYRSIAQYRRAHHRGSANGSIEASAGDWKQAFKKGIIDFQQLVSQLQTLGYAPDAALLIAEIENGGPYQAPQPGPFSTLQAAIAYMVSLGYAISPPPDPRLSAAEQLLAQNGYSWTAPPARLVPSHP